MILGLGQQEMALCTQVGKYMPVVLTLMHVNNSYHATFGL